MALPRGRFLLFPAARQRIGFGCDSISCACLGAWCAEPSRAADKGSSICALLSACDPVRTAWACSGPRTRATPAGAGLLSLVAVKRKPEGAASRLEMEYIFLAAALLVDAPGGYEPSLCTLAACRCWRRLDVPLLPCLALEHKKKHIFFLSSTCEPVCDPTPSVTAILTLRFLLY
jgi:hypothetical protein